ncbi:hypothetical protein BRC87_07325 [Halobacteriales archaeon QS_4_66_20]|nr:MAG: hypothetical protein BRC87_07325 [Halobacteriales archaeon QS_4_66_20]
MAYHSDVPPATLAVELTDAGVLVEYLDGREVLYRGVPTPAEGEFLTTPGKDVHVLVTDDSETSGVLVYLDERRTEDEILEDSGVGRVLLDEGEETTLFPGVRARGGGLRDEIVVDHDAVDGRVFVFEEDQFEERSFELVPDE